jgi:hypothetical protein
VDAQARPAIARTTELFPWTQVEFAKLQDLFCKTADASPILDVHTTDPMVGESW